MASIRKKNTSAILFFIVIALTLSGISFYYYIDNYVNKVVYKIEYENNIRLYSSQYNVDTYLIMAIIKAESGYKPDAVSPVGAVGLMQIMPGTGKEIADKLKIQNYNDDMLKDPDTNIKFGCWYINWLNKEMNYNEKSVLASYNGGIGNVKQWLKNTSYSSDGVNITEIPYKETKIYVEKVQLFKTHFQHIYGNN